MAKCLKYYILCVCEGSSETVLLVYAKAGLFSRLIKSSTSWIFIYINMIGTKNMHSKKKPQLFTVCHISSVRFI